MLQTPVNCPSTTRISCVVRCHGSCTCHSQLDPIRLPHHMVLGSGFATGSMCRMYGKKLATRCGHNSVRQVDGPRVSYMTCLDCFFAGTDSNEDNGHRDTSGVIIHGRNVPTHRRIQPKLVWLGGLPCPQHVGNGLMYPRIGCRCLNMGCASREAVGVPVCSCTPASVHAT